MLVLTRRIDESLTIGDSITVTVLAIEGDKVKLGIAAPREIPILRQEIFLAVQEQNKIKKVLEEGPVEPESVQSVCVNCWPSNWVKSLSPTPLPPEPGDEKPEEMIYRPPRNLEVVSYWSLKIDIFTQFTCGRLQWRGCRVQLQSERAGPTRKFPDPFAVESYADIFPRRSSHATGDAFGWCSN